MTVIVGFEDYILVNDTDALRTMTSIAGSHCIAARGYIIENVIPACIGYCRSIEFTTQFYGHIHNGIGVCVDEFSGDGVYSAGITDAFVIGIIHYIIAADCHYYEYQKRQDH